MLLRSPNYFFPLFSRASVTHSDKGVVRVGAARTAVTLLVSVCGLVGQALGRPNVLLAIMIIIAVPIRDIPETRRHGITILAGGRVVLDAAACEVLLQPAVLLEPCREMAVRVLGVNHLDVFEVNVLDCVFRAQDDADRIAGSHDGDVLEQDVAVVLVVHGATVAEPNLAHLELRPTQTARVSPPELHVIGLLRRTDPDGPLLRLLDVNVLVSHVLDQPDQRGSGVGPELGVDALDGVVHADVPERDVADVCVADGTDGEPKPTGVDSLEQHVLGSPVLPFVLHGDAVILVPDVAVMDPNIPPIHVEAVGVERGDVSLPWKREEIVAVLVIHRRIDVGVSHLESGHVVRPEGPVGRVLQDEVLDKDIARVVDLKQLRPVLAEIGVLSEAVPLVSVAIQQALPVRGEGDVPELLEIHGRDPLAIPILGPFARVIGEPNSSVESDNDVLKASGRDPSSEAERVVREFQSLKRR
mmetsp:Transcript_22231/g.43249  ORF Transcript_22231/g.43249 Transcript_22231/m.43249 type:complete len:471 (-) Transcript_22231:161-1573(-)